MLVLVSGSTGLVGSALIPSLTSQGHRVRRLVRRPNGPDSVVWAPSAHGPDPAALEGVEAVVHLAGESISKRWTETQKRRIRESRVQGTERLVESLKKMKQPPKVLVAASAVGFYGDRGNEILREDANPGTLFLSETCQAWEAAARSAESAGVRVVNVRFGVILSPRGGALGKMLLPFKMGVGGVIGSGQQYMSWIALDDAVGILLYALQSDPLRTPVNATAPEPVTNHEFTKTLGRLLGRPTIFPMPAFAARLAFGEMADELLLASARVEPAAVTKAGYRFRYPTLEPALRHLLS